MSSSHIPPASSAQTPGSAGAHTSSSGSIAGGEGGAARVESLPPQDHSAGFESFATESPPSRWGVLRHKHYRKIIGAQFVSNIGNWAEFFTIQFFVAETTGRLDDQGWLALCQNAPIAAFGLIGGLAADRLNRRTLLVVTQLIAALIAAGVAVVAMLPFENPRTAIHWMFFLGVLHGTVMAFNFPAWQVLTPRLVPKEELARAIVVNGIQFNATRVIGPAVAGFVFARAGAAPVLWFNAVSFALMALVVMTTPNSPAPPRSTDSIATQLREAAQFFIRERGPRAVFFAQVMLSLLAAPLVRLLSNFVIDVYHLTEKVAKETGGNLIAVQGVGAVLGGLALRYVPSWYPRHHFIPIAVTGLALTIIGFALTTSVFWGYIVMGVCGWFWIWAFNQSWASLQVLTPDRLRGRAMSLANVCVFGATGIGVTFAGKLGEVAKEQKWLSDQHATQGSILILAVPLFLAGLVMMARRVPEIDGLSRNPRRKLAWHNAITAAEHRPRRGEATMDTPDSVEAGR